ncbi:D-threonate 4-phosphate dehydrogenase [Geodia barretti]|uniref:D-threonate 4-phosphate dehydrogenase n=1 Tax=Geodia barretti TaxID=519541 RepID=A0AA35SGR8_GEOBA|nr:D-threonate 4-phosphate dehydrogenase [Geodia barretti]
MTRPEVQIQSEATTHSDPHPLLGRGTGTPRTENRPKIGLTMGDAAGIGPEILVKALAHESVYSLCQPIVIGSSAILQDACFRFTTSNKPPLKLNIIKTPTQALARHGTIDVLDVSSISPQDISVGTIDARAGAAAVKAIEIGTHLTMHGELDAITTAPICKAAIHRAGVSYPGHTEMLAAFTNTAHAVMMLCTPEALDGNQPSAIKENLFAEGFREPRVIPAVSFVTNHVALADVSKHLSVERIVEVIRITRQALIRCGISEPRLVVAGLNPHAGEDGAFGKEEEYLIRPAIAQAEAHFGTIDGPLPADALFVKAIQGEWHAVIVMYHDQGNIPIKLLGFGELVNVTLGLPIVRTSVDHGTAFDIAGKGIANEMSLVEALSCAVRLTNASQRENPL